eukprot:NODE_10151_length_1373_cov_8.131621.p1 GENE.NODE_10151_length_1373_cov_8.131621~~NODE_10151_length_1373_cov_8.131621.p1  ORF type:complete len:401 (+),score=107.74 NODE_10151_length_1373_cov_8.131621:123-1205(+)
MSFEAITAGAIWTDCTTDETERVKMSRLENLLMFVGIPLQGLNYVKWSNATEGGATPESLEGFAWFAVKMGVLGVISSLLALLWLAPLERRALARRRDATTSETPSSVDVRAFLSNIVRHRNFWCFVVVSVLNEVQSTFNTEFSAIVTDVHLRGILGIEGRAAYLATEQGIIGVSNLVIMSVLAQCMGVYHLFRLTIIAKVAVGAALLFMPPLGVVGAAYFLLSNVCTAGAMCYWRVMVASIVDEYMHKNGGRRRSVSVVGLFWGIHALLAKPCDSLAPTVASYVLERAGWTGKAMTGPVTEEALTATYRLVLGFPVFLGVVQLLAWRYFDLHGEKLATIQAENKGMEAMRLGAQAGLVP